MILLTHVLCRTKVRSTLGGRKKINHLLFMDNLKLYGKKQSETKGSASTGVVFNEEIGMEFGIKKHSAITMDREKFKSKDEIELPSSEKIRQIGRLRHMKNIVACPGVRFSSQNSEATDV